MLYKISFCLNGVKFFVVFGKIANRLILHIKMKKPQNFVASSDEIFKFFIKILTLRATKNFCGSLFLFAKSNN